MTLDIKERALTGLRRLRVRRRSQSSCHGSGPTAASGLPTLVIVGNPNVGKSALFNRLTGARVVVSNYPGTTVEVTRGHLRADGVELEAVDTPGMYSFLPITEEERVARRILLSESSYLVLHVVDAKNLERMLPFTLQLIEAGLPVVLAVNMLDEAEAAGLEIDLARLEQELGVPVVGTISTSGRGIDTLRHRIATTTASVVPPRTYDDKVEAAVSEMEGMLKGEYRLSRRAVALLLLQDDAEIEQMVEDAEGDGWGSINEFLLRLRTGRARSLGYTISMQRQRWATSLVRRTVLASGRRGRNWGELISRVTMNPITGVPILLLVLYFGLYQFVGVFGAGVLVKFLEDTVFGQWVNPVAIQVVEAIIPWPILQTLFVGEYGIITLGIRYAIALILPIVGTFFLTFSILEDTGYFPRLAMLIDRVFKAIGLNGRAVIPMVLGFGCDTMATMVTRVLESRRERVIATLLLALAIPCSAQLGVILAILSPHPRALALWGVIVLAVFLLIGLLAARVMPGQRPSFYMEVPPMRMPRLGNILSKTYARMEWYLFEVMPVFIGASVIIWIGQITGIFQALIRLFEPIVELIGLPPQVAAVFLFGFFRRDYGAAGLYDVHAAGGLSGEQLLVAAVTLTLFVPCIAQFSMMLKERGVRTTLAIVAFIFPFAFGIGFVVNALLTAAGWQL
ncbi:MAG: ferrous iron transport protein B [Actinobacteria bacterium]|nr:ferrous iron transport protein B [Actinomycetota bacterium]MCL5025216.1 ferrous iron transport protein B [Chloroflexota bacterium]